MTFKKVLSKNKKLIIFFVLVSIILFSKLAYADMVWPAMFLGSKLTSWWVILSGLVIEYFFVLPLTKFNLKQSFVIDITMNLVSTILGYLLILLFGMGAGLFPFPWLATFILAVIINGLLESFVVTLFLKTRIGWRLFGWLCLANTLSVGLAMISLKMEGRV